MPQLQRALATLAFGTRTLAERPKLAPYAALFSDAAWGSLLEAFHRELYRLHCLLPESALSVHLQVAWVWLEGRDRGLACVLDARASLTADTPSRSVHLPDAARTHKHKLTQAGLVALKNTPSTASASRQDPLSHPDFAALASHLPAAKHVHSKLICAITREIMSDANPPLVLPNGYVYSQGGCEALAAAHGGGRVVCPRTGAEYGLEEARRAYIV
jgi:macrophage erythroblast attacher